MYNLKPLSDQLQQNLRTALKYFAEDTYGGLFVIPESHEFQNLLGKSVMMTINIAITDPDRLFDYLMRNAVEFKLNQLETVDEDDLISEIDRILRTSADTNAGVPTEEDGVEYDFESIDWALS